MNIPCKIAAMPSTELLASCSMKVAAEVLAKAIRLKFYRIPYVLYKPEYELLYQVMTDEELTQSLRLSIKNFVKEYVRKEEAKV